MKDWKQGEKHPDTPATPYRNCWEWDFVRRSNTARCRVCDAYCPPATDDDGQGVRWIEFVCEKRNCYCKRPYTTKVHQVCSVCFWMWKSLYANSGLTDKDHFKKAHDSWKAGK